jgi:hypothetical protein
VWPDPFRFLRFFRVSLGANVGFAVPFLSERLPMNDTDASNESLRIYRRSLEAGNVNRAKLGIGIGFGSTRN